MAFSSSFAGRCGILDSKLWGGRFSTRNLANFLLLLAPKGRPFVSTACKAAAVKVAGAPASQDLQGEKRRREREQADPVSYMKQPGALSEPLYR